MKLDEDVLTRKIANLLRRAERADGPEAATARDMAERLMEKHSLQVVLDPRESADYEEYKMQVFPPDRAWATTLAGALAKQHSCNAYFQATTDGFGFLVITGSATRVLSLQRAYNHYLDQILRIGSRGASPSFRLGAAVAVSDMFAEQLEQARKIRKSRTAPKESTALARRRKYVEASVKDEPSTPRVHEGTDGTGKPVGQESSGSSAYMQGKKTWVEPPVNNAIYSLGYGLMRKALGVAMPIRQWFQRKQPVGGRAGG